MPEWHACQASEAYIFLLSAEPAHVSYSQPGVLMRTNEERTNDTETSTDCCHKSFIPDASHGSGRRIACREKLGFAAGQ